MERYSSSALIISSTACRTFACLGYISTAMDGSSTPSHKRVCTITFHPATAMAILLMECFAGPSHRCLAPSMRQGHDPICIGRVPACQSAVGHDPVWARFLLTLFHGLSLTVDREFGEIGSRISERVGSVRYMSSLNGFRCKTRLWVCPRNTFDCMNFCVC